MKEDADISVQNLEHSNQNNMILMQLCYLCTQKSNVGIGTDPELDIL